MGATMKHYTARLHDRFVLGDRLVIRACDDKTGQYLDVAVPLELREKAASIHGGGCVRYVYRGGHAVFTGTINDYPTED